LNGRPKRPFLTALITWAPFLFLIGLWWLFMKRMNVFGKRGYADYMRVTQERIERIEMHLADIAASLRKIAESGQERR
jgi:ATP-dependent Zn protease